MTPSEILIHNERTKLTANALNTLATGTAMGSILTVGLPMALADKVTWQKPLVFIVVAGVGLAIAFRLHMYARQVLGGLKA